MELARAIAILAAITTGAALMLQLATIFVGIDRWLARHSTPPKQPLNI